MKNAKPNSCRECPRNRQEVERIDILLTHDMRSTILFLMAGIFGGALIFAAISVYMFHDVDQDKLGHWNEAYIGLCAESVLFTLVIGGGVALLTVLGRRLLHLSGEFPRAMLGFLLGVGVTLSQYPWDYAVRRRLPKLSETSLYLYLILAIVFCTIVIVRDQVRQAKLSEAPATSSTIDTSA